MAFNQGADLLAVRADVFLSLVALALFLLAGLMLPVVSALHLDFLEAPCGRKVIDGPGIPAVVEKQGV